MGIMIRIFIGRFIILIIKLLSHLPLGDVKNTIVRKLTKFKNRILPNLFDSQEFLSYVYIKQKGLENNLETIKTLAFRGSNSDYSFYTPIWENSYNLGLTSTDLYTTYYLYKNYRFKLKNLENIILFFNIPSTGYSLVHTAERYRAVSYKYFFNIPYLSSNLIEPVFEKWIINKCKKLKPFFINKDYRGYIKQTYYGTNILASERTKTHLRENKREPNQLHWIESLAEMIHFDNRRLVIIIPPIRKDYKELLPPQAELFKKLFSIEGLNFINLYDSEIFNDNDHGDTDHLNEKGAIKLTKEIKQVFENNNWL